MSDVRLIYKNYWRLGTIYNYSSQHPQFPATDTQIDTLVQFWRSRYGTGSGNGTFVITAGNKYIDFDEGGAELTATLTLGIYNGTTLAAEIQTRMRAVGAKLYVVTYSETTAKFTIAAPSNFTIRWNTGTHKATDISDTCGYDDGADNTGNLTYTGNYRRIHYPSECLDNDILDTQQINFIAILNHNFGPNAVITLWGANNSDFTGGVESVVIPYNLSNIFFFFPTAISKRYWRLEISDPANANNYLRVATLILGSYWQPTRNIRQKYSDGYDDQSLIDVSDSLNEFGQPKPIYKVCDFPIPIINAEKSSLDSFLIWTGIVNGFIVCLDYTSPNGNSYFMKNTELVQPAFGEGEIWDWGIRAKEVL